MTQSVGAVVASVVAPWNKFYTVYGRVSIPKLPNHIGPQHKLSTFPTLHTASRTGIHVKQGNETFSTTKPCRSLGLCPNLGTRPNFPFSVGHHRSQPAAFVPIVPTLCAEGSIPAGSKLRVRRRGLGFGCWPLQALMNFQPISSASSVKLPQKIKISSSVVE
jgi:hypothetical protein